MPLLTRTGPKNRLVLVFDSNTIATLKVQVLDAVANYCNENGCGEVGYEDLLDPLQSGRVARTLLLYRRWMPQRIGHEERENHEERQRPHWRPVLPTGFPSHRRLPSAFLGVPCGLL